MESLQQIFPQMLSKLPFNRQYRSRTAMYHWPEIVGREIAEQSVPVKLEYKVLLVYVKSSVWSHHLMLMKLDILEKFNAYAGDNVANDLRFTQQYQFNDAADSSTKSEAEDIGRELRHMGLEESESGKIKNMVASLKNGELKSRLAGVYRRELLLRRYHQQKQYHHCKSCNSLCPADDTYCSVCSRSQREQKKQKLRQILKDVPWATYADICNEIPCTAAEYIDAKIALQRLFADNLPRTDECPTDSMELKVLAMLFTGAKYNELNENLLKRTFRKFRRRSYVSTSGVRHSRSDERRDINK